MVEWRAAMAPGAVWCVVWCAVWCVVCWPSSVLATVANTTIDSQTPAADTSRVTPTLPPTTTAQVAHISQALGNVVLAAKARTTVVPGGENQATVAPATATPAPQTATTSSEFDLKASIILNQVTLEHLLQQQQLFTSVIGNLTGRVENVSRALSSHLSPPNRCAPGDHERAQANVSQLVLERLNQLNHTLSHLEKGEDREAREVGTELERVREALAEETAARQEAEGRLLATRKQLTQAWFSGNLTLQMSAEADRGTNDSRRTEERQATESEERRKVEAEKLRLEERVREMEEATQRLEESLAREKEERREEGERAREAEEERSHIEAKNRLMEEELGRCKANLTESRRSVLARDCAELYCAGVRKDGEYVINPGSDLEPVTVWCVMTRVGGGWTMFLRRDQQQDPPEVFGRGWADYRTGFGERGREHWLGLEWLHQLTRQPFPHQNHLLLEATKLGTSEQRWAMWHSFSVAAEDTQYRLHVAGFDNSSTLGDAITNHHNLSGMKFSTRDRDNDAAAGRDCVSVFSLGGGWWYANCAYLTPTGPHAGSGKHMLAYWSPRHWAWVDIQNLHFMVRPAAFNSRCHD